MKHDNVNSEKPRTAACIQKFNIITYMHLICFVTQEKIGRKTVEINGIELELSCLFCLSGHQWLHSRNYDRLQHHCLNRQDHNFGDCPGFLSWKKRSWKEHELAYNLCKTMLWRIRYEVAVL